MWLIVSNNLLRQGSSGRVGRKKRGNWREKLENHWISFEKLGYIWNQLEKLENECAKLEKLELEILESPIQDLGRLGWLKPCAKVKKNVTYLTNVQASSSKCRGGSFFMQCIMSETSDTLSCIASILAPILLSWEHQTSIQPPVRPRWCT